MSPISALPDKMKDLSFWDGTDNASWLMKLKKRIQYVFAAGSRVPSGFWKWREIPKTIFAKKGDGHWRYENTDGSSFQTEDTVLNPPDKSGYYLSRIQCWSRWHLALQWPIWFQFHWIYRKKDVPDYPTYQSDFGIMKAVFFGIGWKRDSDLVYWLTANAGGNAE